MLSEPFLVDVRSKKLCNQGICGVRIHNTSQFTTTFWVAGQAKNKDLHFETRPNSVQIQAAQRGALCVRVSVMKRPLLGFIPHLPFTLSVTTSEGKQAVINGRLDVHPYISMPSVCKTSFIISAASFLSLAAKFVKQGYVN